MLISDLDLAALQVGQPPHNNELLQAMTIGRQLMLNNMKQHYLFNYVASGGSKVNE